MTNASRGNRESGDAVLGRDLAAMLLADFDLGRRIRPVIGVAGESASGKSTTATALARELGAIGIATGVIHQDDYFIRPPRTNHEHRVRDLSSVGPQEVNLALIASHIVAFRERRSDVSVPRVDYPANRFVIEQVDFAPLNALIVEGTYVLQLGDIDVRIFHDATHVDTLDRRRARNRDIDAPIIDQVLAIEHEIVSRQARVAQIVIDRSFTIHRSR